MFKNFFKFTILSVFSLAFSFFLLSQFPSLTVGAADIKFTPQIGIPGDSDFAPGKTITIPGDTSAIAKYVKAIYKYLIGVVGILAAIMLMVGGVVWLTAGGSPDKVKQAQDYIKGSITGLVLALTSFLILSTINPALVDFRISGIQSVKENTNKTTASPSGCCLYTGTQIGAVNSEWQICSITTLENCTPLKMAGINLGVVSFNQGKICDRAEFKAGQFCNCIDAPGSNTQDQCGGCKDGMICAKISFISGVEANIGGINNYACLKSSAGKCSYVINAKKKTDNQIVRSTNNVKDVSNEEQCLKEIAEMLTMLTKDSFLNDFYFSVTGYSFVSN